MKNIHILKAADALTKLASQDGGMPKDSPRNQNGNAQDAQGKILRYFTPFLSAPLLILFAITVCAAFLAEEAAIGYTSLFAFGLFLYVWYAAYRSAVESIEKKEALCGAYIRVVREGEQLLLPSEDLVCGDIVLMKQGDRLFADCRILDADSLFVKERISGEERCVNKYASPCEGRYEDADNMLWTDSVILAGSCRALVAAVGDGRRVTANAADLPGENWLLGKFSDSLKKISLTASVSLLGIVFFAAIFGLTPLSANGLWQDWLFAVSFAATTAVELLTLAQAVSLSHALSLNTTVFPKNNASFETLASVDHVILPTRAFRDELSCEASAFLLPGEEGVGVEVLSASPTEAGKRLLKNAVLTVNACKNGGLSSPLWYNTVDKPISALCEKYAFTYTDTAETIAVCALENSLFCRIFRRGENTFVSLCGDCRYLLPLAGFWYCGDTIAPFRESDGACFLKPGAVGVAIGTLPRDAAYDERSLMKALSGKLVFEGAIMTESDTAAFSAWYRRFSDAGISLAVVCENAVDYSVFQKLTAKTPVTLLNAPSPKALSDYISAKRKSSKTVLFAMRDSADAEAASFADVSVFHTDLPKREAEKPSVRPQLADHGASDARAAADWLYSASSSALADMKRALCDSYDRVTKATSYLFCTLAVKLFPTLFAIVLGKDLVSALFFVLMGFGFDTLAVFSVIYRPTGKDMHSFSSARLFERVIASLATGSLAGIGALVFSLVVSSYFSLSAEVFSTVAILAVSLVSFGLRYFQPHSRFSPTASLGTGLTVGGSVLLFVLLLARGSFGKFGLLFLVANIALLLSAELTVFLILKKFRRTSAKKSEKSCKKKQKKT